MRAKDKARAISRGSEKQEKTMKDQEGKERMDRINRKSVQKKKVKGRKLTGMRLKRTNRREGRGN